MNGKQALVMWLGILLIASQLYFGGQWKILFGNIKATSSSSSTKQNVGTGQLGPTGKEPL
jgi:hypothetical protein